MAWILLLIAGLLETVWALAMKASNGFTHPVWTIVTIVSAGVSFWLARLCFEIPAGGVCLRSLDGHWRGRRRYRRRCVL
jgi:multidrug transporter EmrE-like cation transporter